MKPSPYLVEQITEGIENAEDLPQQIEDRITQMDGDVLEPSAIEMALAGTIVNSLSEEDLVDELSNLIEDLRNIRANLESKT